jgi:hypothetical protein
MLLPKMVLFIFAAISIKALSTSAFLQLASLTQTSPPSKIKTGKILLMWLYFIKISKNTCIGLQIAPLSDCFRANCKEKLQLIPLSTT